MSHYILEIAYLIASVLYIFGLKMMSDPKSARKGNLWAAAGMTVAVAATIFLYKDESGNHLHNLPWIAGGIVIGSILGYLMAKRVQMTDMPQMVSLFNGMGGACAAIIGLIEFPHYAHDPNASMLTLLTIYAGLVIGSTSFAGSM
ncbi:MAG: NAD(P)(+) transhydrogenase (Re/Si-specific) subunit beta, partial [Flavobacteriales bacterium]|nr:NAD(P)(+) transhydrogenase (Re/Si-specific) subunit beta [Flavobacteriales bacterium]